MSTPLFTILIPTYNSAEKLAGCLESVVTQSMQNFEILIIDGLSTDTTIQIAKEYASMHSTVRWLSEKDMGIYDAMNKGITISKGQWIYFMGSDDTLFNNEVLLRIAEEIKSEPSLEIIYGNVFSERFKGVYGEAYDEKKILQQNICHQGIFFSKTVFKKTGNFNLLYTAQADWDHNLKWLLNEQIKKKYVNVIVAHYADGGFSSTRGDEVFYRDLRLNYIQYGRAVLSFWRKYLLLQYEFLKSLKNGDRKKLLSVLNHIKYLKS